MHDVATGQLTLTLSGPTKAVQKLALSPCGGLLAAGSDDGAVYVWNL